MKINHNTISFVNREQDILHELKRDAEEVKMQTGEFTDYRMDLRLFTMNVTLENGEWLRIIELALKGLEYERMHRACKPYKREE